jgi:hypothetical protein
MTSCASGYHAESCSATAWKAGAAVAVWWGMKSLAVVAFLARLRLFSAIVQVQTTHSQAHAPPLVHTARGGRKGAKQPGESRACLALSPPSFLLRPALTPSSHSLPYSTPPTGVPFLLSAPCARTRQSERDGRASDQRAVARGCGLG